MVESSANIKIRKERITMPMWWDLKNTSSYNALFNFVGGSRGCGKTYGFKNWAAEDFIKNGN